MFFILSKVFSFLCSPFTWLLLLLIATLAFGRYRKKLLLTTLIIFYFFSNEFIFSEFMRAWEILPQKPGVITEEYDVAIVLGGYATYDKEYDMAGFHESTDRVLIALQLYKTGKVKKLLLSGGSGNLLDTSFKESDIMLKFLTSIGINNNDLLIENRSKNTRQNATYSSEILNERFTNGRFLLVTSAYHMRRSLKCFAKTGINVESYSVDRIAGKRRFQFNHLFIPKVEVLGKWDLLIHEWVGYITYAMMGYI